MADEALGNKRKARKSTTEAPDSQPKRINAVEVIVPNGDLIVRVRTENEIIQYQVGAQILWNASDVFRASFGPESDFETARQLRKSGSATTTLEDDAEAMGLVLKLICLRKESLPKSISFETLHAVATIGDKYGLEIALSSQSMVSDWSRELRATPPESGTIGSWLFISWAFGYDDIFQDISNEITLCEAACLDSIAGVPQVVLDQLTKLRNQRVQKMRDFLDESEAKYREGRKGSWSCKLSRTKPAARNCHILHQGLIQHVVDSYQLDEISTWDNHSLRFLEKSLLAVEEVHFDNHYYHQCGWLHGFQTLVAETVAEKLCLQLSDFPSRGA